MSEHATVDVPQDVKAPRMTGRQTCIVLLSFLLAIAFFLPWINFLGKTVSGFELFQNGGEIESRLLIIVPGMAIIALLTGIGKPAEARLVAIIAGIIPFVVFVFYWGKVGSDIFQILGIGAYLSLLLAILLIGTGCGKDPA